MIRKRTQEEILEIILEELEENTDLTGLSEGSAARNLAEIIAMRLGELYGDSEFNSDMAFLTRAKGIYLDLHAEAFGLTRIEAQPAISYASDKIIKFYCNTGVLKDHLPVGYIDSGTEIYNSDRSIVYRVATRAYFSDTDNEVYVTAGATVSGEEYNVGKNELTSHSLNQNDVLVTNMSAIRSGAGAETNDNLKYRISNAPLLLATSNLDAIKSTISIVPGVSDIIVTPYDQGVGSVGIKVVPTANVLTDNLVAQVSGLASSVKAAGDYLHVDGPDYCPVQIWIQLLFNQGVSDGEKNTLITPCENAVLNYMSELRMGQTFVVNEMIQRVMDVSDLILDMKVRCFNFRGRPQALRNFIPREDEVLIPDPDVDNPIQVFV